MIEDAEPLFERGEKMQLHLQRAEHPPRDRHAAVVATITRKFGMTGLQPGHI